MTTATRNAARLNELVAEGRAVAYQHEDAMTSVYRAGLRRLAREATRNLHRHAITAAATEPRWTPPDADEILSLAKAAAELEQRSERLRHVVLRVSMEGALAEFGLSFDVTNPLVQGVLEQAGQRITGVAETERAAIMQQLSQAHADGLSVPHAAKRIREQAYDMSQKRAEVIARTELNAINNGGSLALARLTGAASVKIWLTAGDDRVRPGHQEAEGQEQALGDPFEVDGEELQYPSEPNCRCTVTYSSGEADALAAAATPATPAAAPGERPIVVRVVTPPAPLPPDSPPIIVQHIPAPETPAVVRSLEALASRLEAAEQRVATLSETSAAPRRVRVDRDDEGRAIRYVEEPAGG